MLTKEAITAINEGEAIRAAHEALPVESVTALPSDFKLHDLEPFYPVRRRLRGAMETNSIFNLCTHATLASMNSIASRQMLDLFSLPEGVKALRLVEPDARRTIGLVVADRHPEPPLARKLMETAIAVTPELDG